MITIPELFQRLRATLQAMANHYTDPGPRQFMAQQDRIRAAQNYARTLQAVITDPRHRQAYINAENRAAAEATAKHHQQLRAEDGAAPYEHQPKGPPQPPDQPIIIYHDPEEIPLPSHHPEFIQYQPRPEPTPNIDQLLEAISTHDIIEHYPKIQSTADIMRRASLSGHRHDGRFDNQNQGAIIEETA